MSPSPRAEWMVLEQVAVAALDLHKMTVAEDCLVMLAKQFPGSQRVRKLKALRLEALERSVVDDWTAPNTIHAAGSMNVTCNFVSSFFYYF